MKHETSNLDGVLLDAAVSKALGRRPYLGQSSPKKPNPASDVEWRTEDGWPVGAASSDWSIGGPLIYLHQITILAPDERPDQLTIAILEWTAAKYTVDDEENEFEYECTGPTPLIAAMRSFVLSKLGPEVDLP